MYKGLGGRGYGIKWKSGRELRDKVELAKGGGGRG